MKKAAKKPTKKAVKKASKRTGNIVPQASLSFGSVVDSVSRLHTEFLRQATHAVNVSLTLRNWLIGAYIHEYELRGADRAKYGENPVPELADALTKRGIPGCDQRELYRHRQFFRLYPQILGALTPKLQVHGTKESVRKKYVLDGKGFQPTFQTVASKSYGIKARDVCC